MVVLLARVACPKLSLWRWAEKARISLGRAKTLQNVVKLSEWLAQGNHNRRICRSLQDKTSKICINIENYRHSTKGNSSFLAFPSQQKHRATNISAQDCSQEPNLAAKRAKIPSKWRSVAPHSAAKTHQRTELKWYGLKVNTFYYFMNQLLI